MATYFSGKISNKQIIKRGLMDIKSKLMSKFSEVIDVYYEKEAKNNFLRVETNLTRLRDIEVLTMQVSNFLDEIDYSNTQYYLDIFSSGKSVPDKDLVDLDKD